ncbi:MAG: Yip1 domain membrane protein [Rhodobacteraceae bacterium HLUCCA12]|nr:MAG: Yip1 domain membrane protein [Rhodobacteraceae bacterium HLUCCA12]
MNRDDITALVRLSVTEPEKGAQAVMALDPPLPARWMLMVFAVTLGVVLAYLLPVIAGQGPDLPSPFAAAMLQGGMNLVAVFLITGVGRLFGGTGRFEDALLLVGWLQLLMAGVQLVQLLVLLVLPPLGSVVMVAAVALFFWLLSGFIRALHGFQSRFVVLLGTLGTLFVAAFVMSVILILLGFELPEMTNV